MPLRRPTGPLKTITMALVLAFIFIAGGYPGKASASQSRLRVEFQELEWFCVETFSFGKSQRNMDRAVVRRLTEKHGLYAQACDQLSDPLNPDPRMGRYRIELKDRSHSKMIISGTYVVQFKARGARAAITWSREMGGVTRQDFHRNKHAFLDYVVDQSLMALFKSQSEFVWRRTD